MSTSIKNRLGDFSMWVNRDEYESLKRRKEYLEEGIEKAHKVECGLRKDIEFIVSKFISPELISYYGYNKNIDCSQTMINIKNEVEDIDRKKKLKADLKELGYSKIGRKK
jgi:hypothetical protein